MTTHGTEQEVSLRQSFTPSPVGDDVRSRTVINTPGIASLPRSLRASAAFAVLLAFTLSALAQYSIDWFSIDGGGGTSSGGDYTLTGTIGQADAGPEMSGGDYSLVGGFLSIVTVIQTPGAPELTVTRDGADVIISWPSPSTGWQLEQKAALTLPSWSIPSETVSDDATTKSIRVVAPTGNRFYRLSKP